jgi:hypothetical protein
MRNICHLCKKEKPLLKKSHILSDFLYKDLYDENHKLISFEMKELKKITPRISKPSTGVNEGSILCFDCDNNVIGNYENYASKFISNKEKINCFPNENKEGLKFINLSNINYNYTKLFLLSLLWRASISKRRDYREVSLGPYEEKIRSKLLKGKCLEPPLPRDCIACAHNSKKIMILLNATPNGPFIDPRFLSTIDVPFILLAIILLIVMYFKV